MASSPATNSSPLRGGRKLPISSRAPLRKETLHSVEVWESKREVIKELYMAQKKPLREVSRILETQHNFIASPKQYKIRFRQWGYWKNLSTQHASSLLQLKESRESLGKPSAFTRSGQELEHIRIERTIRRSKARATGRHQSKHIFSESSVVGPIMSRAHTQTLPTGIECRTPSPESWLHHGQKPVSAPDCQIDSDLFALPTIPEAYNFETAVDLQKHENIHLRKLKVCEIATRKLWAVRSSWDSPSPFDHSAGIQAFRHRNTLLAILEAAVIDQDRLCTVYLQIYAAAFLDSPELSHFSRQYVLPALDQGERSGEQAALAVEADEFIQTGINMLNLSPNTISLVGSAKAFDRGHILLDNISRTQYDNAINPALLNGSLGLDLSSKPFYPFAFGLPQGQLVDSGASSPTTTTTSACLSATSPSTLFDDASTVIEATLPDERVTPTTGHADQTLESQLSSKLNLSVSLYQSGNIASAKIGLLIVAASEVRNSTRNKVLSRLAWFCLFCIHWEVGMVHEAEDCLVKAVRGSTHFRNDRGEEWHEVSHLFL